MSEYALEMVNISKSFPGVQALVNVCLKVRKGHVHAIVGENGAGKSTLMKVLNGVYHAEFGEIYLEGKKVNISDIRMAQELGLSLIFQETNLIPQLTVAENFFLGNLRRNRFGLVDWKAMENIVKGVFASLDYNINPTQIIRDLCAADKQMVEIAKAISQNAKIIVMDEPTSSLTSVEIKKLFSIINNLKRQGVTIIFISHKMDEIFEIADMVTVQRDGHIITTESIGVLTPDRIIELMVGRSVNTEFPKREVVLGEVVLETQQVCRKNVIYDVNLQLHKGEILGLAGLVGAGRTELAEVLFGAAKKSSGKIILKGKEIHFKTTRQATRASIGMLTEERKETGLALTASVKSNIVISKLKKICNIGFWLNKNKEKAAADKYVKELNIRTPSINQIVMNLSGGNQQKVVLSKWLFSDSDILIMDEPTRGIDVGAKYEIYCLMNKLVEQGKSIIFISSELMELLGICDRIIVLHQGHKKGELMRNEFSSEAVMKLAIK